MASRETWQKVKTLFGPLLEAMIVPAQPGTVSGCAAGAPKL
jgi:hypothetical protein